MTDTEHPLRAGIEALSAWLAAHKVSANRFAIQNGIDPSLLGKLLRGVPQRVSTDLTHKIARATNDGVPMSIWAPSDTKEGEHDPTS
jgi:hypothetical protein